MPKLTSVLLLSFVFVLYSCSKKDNVDTPAPLFVIQAPPAFGFYVVGYFPSYRNLSDVPDIKFRMCNVVNYAFVNIDANGLPVVGNASLMAAVIAKTKANNAKAFVSINDGSGDGKSYFKNMAATATSRNNCIKGIMNTVRNMACRVWM